MRFGILGVVALGLLAAGCGSDETQRAATGGLTGAGIGALAGGPIGAIVGAGVGAVGGSTMPEGADQVAAKALGREHQAAQKSFNEAGVGSGSSESTVANAGQSPDTIRAAQTKLQQGGYYKGPIDGIVGAQTREATRAYQEHEGLPQTASLDQQTLQHLNVTPGAGASGSSTQNQAALSPQQVSNRLASQGYSNVRDVRQVGTTYVATATRNNTDYALQVDAHSGRVVSQHAAQNDGTAGTSAAPASNAPPPNGASDASGNDTSH